MLFLVYQSCTCLYLQDKPHAVVICACVCVCVCVVQRATPSSTAKATTGTLDERLAQLRQQRQRDAAAASANKSVAFAGDEPAASINVARARPMTAPVAQVLTSTLHSDFL